MLPKGVSVLKILVCFLKQFQKNSRGLQPGSRPLMQQNTIFPSLKNTWHNKIFLLTCDNPKMGQASNPFLAPNKQDLQSLKGY